MITKRPSGERGHAKNSWLDTYHTFSFGSYHDADQLGFRQLRVLNEDRVEPGKGFGTHAHWEMEIVTVVLSGALEHKDSLGSGSVMRPGDMQRMTAGAGITHSEFNHSEDESLHFLQIWILPESPGLTPSYEQIGFPEDERRGRLRLVASRDGRDGSLTVHQDLSIFASILAPGESAEHTVAPDRHAWVQVARGALQLNGMALAQGDGAAVSDEPAVKIEATEPAELLLFDLA